MCYDNTDNDDDDDLIIILFYWSINWLYKYNTDAKYKIFIYLYLNYTQCVKNCAVTILLLLLLQCFHIYIHIFD